MQRYLISVHLHVMTLIIGVIFVPLVIDVVRRFVLKKSLHDAETNNKIRLDVATIIPVGVLLWNLCVFYISNIGATAPSQGPSPAKVADLQPLTFEACVAAAGESTVALAAAIIFARLFGSIWKDAWRS